ncbi:DNA-binding transcriptional regulator, MocR family, contains an aminotransferase domain [Clostridium sp. DSM 8431]|uniref:aminotransferase-like domain-containing protein n=1 Tax=Clostridium sp. DSM 8431 TaxID=1761781 RepID=UPI0008ECB470|nr:PLP-dependent aminotransferase family protein [Clostridium sp. DSM 8431]SFU33893.1 DNA-binding transcriptional regulator, MocR family, contains an aminotransferase domain [Clostridium sp. DSM 8431]
MKEYFKVDFKQDIPKYIQIAWHLKKLIESKKIEDGEKLPTIREYTEYLGVNKITVINAYKKLDQEGFAFQKIGSGTYAKRKENTSLFRKEYSKTFKILLTKDNLDNIIDFSGETVGEFMFPIDEFKKIINTVLDRDGSEALISQSSLGYEKLRKTINNVFWNNSLEDEDILIVSGAQQGIDIASKAILNINDNIIVEKPTYGGALSVFKWRRANIFEADMEDDGVNLEAFEEILKRNKIRCFYTMSYFQNPTGISYSLEKKKKIIELAEKYDFYIIEDDYLSELIYDKDTEYITFKNLDKHDRVIYVKSFSKIFLPGIRIGYMIAPKSFKESMLTSKVNTDITTSSLMQRVLEIYISRGLWKDNVKHLNNEYRSRYFLMRRLLEIELSTWVDFISPGGGLTFYLRLKEDTNITSKELFFKLRERGVYITPGVLFFKKMNEGDKTFRISFSQTNEEKILKGIRIIKEELKTCHI